MFDVFPLLHAELEFGAPGQRLNPQSQSPSSS